MGWSWSQKARSADDVVAELRREAYRPGITIIADALVKNEEGDGYAYFEVVSKQGQRWINITLIKKEDGQWGHRVFSEADMPYAFYCPLRLLDLAGTDTRPPASEEWRENVREYHSLKREKKAEAAKRVKAAGEGAAVGQRWGIGDKAWTITTIKAGPKKAIGLMRDESTGKVYSFTAKDLAMMTLLDENVAAEPPKAAPAPEPEPAREEPSDPFNDREREAYVQAIMAGREDLAQKLWDACSARK